jgi:hypothetical protein
MANLFDKAKETTTKVKAEKHEVVEMPQFTKSLKQIIDIDAKIAELAATRETLDSEIREAGKEAMINLYNKKGSFPGTLKIVAGENSFQFITSDKYLKVDADRYAELAKMFGSEIAEEKTKYFFNTAILEKYQDVISDMILKSKKIEDADKARLIESETSYTVKKGTISNLAALAKKFSKSVVGIAGLIEEVKPIFSVKITK